MYVDPVAFGTVMGSPLQTMLVVFGTEEVTVPELRQPSQPAASDIDQYGSHATAVLKVAIQCFPQSDARGGGHCPKYRSRASGAEQPRSETVSAIRTLALTSHQVVVVTHSLLLCFPSNLTESTPLLPPCCHLQRLTHGADWA